MSVFDTPGEAVLQVEVPRRFAALERALGEGALTRLSQAHVVVAGIGGVGSWAAEALARSAVGRLTLIDLDHISLSNINRQVHALDSTVGQSKVLAMAQRIALINPECTVELVDDFVQADNVTQVIPCDADIVLDCTDQMQAKIAMVLTAKQHQQQLLVCGAAGGKTDAGTLRITDLRVSTHDRLLARLRHQLRKHHGYASADSRRQTAMGVSVLWLAQPAMTPPPAQGGAGGALACGGYGSLVTVTASMGLAAAAWAIDQIAQQRVVRRHNLGYESK